MSDRHVPGRDGPRTIAHRGYAGVAPENTLAAIRAVADGTHPAEMVELDVVPCADGTPVVFHDARLDAGGESRGITDGSGVVWETARDDVLGAQVLDTDETVPTLAAALDALDGVAVNLELKNPGSFDVGPGEALDPDEVAAGRGRWDPFVQRVLETLDDAGGEALASSFHEPAIAAVRDYEPALPVATLVSRSIDDGLIVAERYGCEAINPHVDVVLGQTGAEDRGGDASGDLLAAADDLGCDVNVWTVTTWRAADRLAAAGVDGVIADYPGLFHWRGEP